MTPMEMVTCKCGKRVSLERVIINSNSDYECEACSTDGETYPVITLYQPWATWIMRGWKTIETRTHDRFKSLAGKTILIHAGVKTDVAALTNPYLTRKQILHDPDEVVSGAILGKAFVCRSRKLTGESSHAALIDCENMVRYGLFLEGITKFPEPIYCKGEMGIWYYNLVRGKVKKTSPSIFTMF